jgi:hypothetical protein
MPAVLLHPLTAASILAASITLLLALVLANLRAGQKLRKRLEQSERDAAARDGERKAQIASLRAELEELRKSIAVMPSLPGGGVNLTRRSQALRMHRGGETPEKIASALGMSRSEVDLLLKVHRTLVARL